MFSAAASTPDAGCAELRVLRLSLNTPVVAIEDLPVGPAAAGIALHDGPTGSQLTLVVRSVRTGQVVFFRPDEEWIELHDDGLVVDAALSFAEGMGFLFDDDPLEAGADPREAARLWSEFMEERAPDEQPGSAEEEPRPEELAPAAAAVLLTKFRFRPAVSPEARSAAARRDRGAARGGVWIRLLSRL